MDKDCRKKQEVYSSLCDRFHPVFRHFFMERFPEPGDWYERRLAYTRSVATNSIGQPLILLLSVNDYSTACRPYSCKLCMFHKITVLKKIGVGCAEATNALPRPHVAPATGQDSTTLPHRSCEGRHVLSRGQPVQ